MGQFAAFLTEWLAKTGWSASRLARESGLKQNTISRWTGTEPTRPSPENLRKLAPVVRVAYDDLLRMCGYLDGTPDMDATDEKVSYELLRRLERMQALLNAGYPKATLLAVLDANIRMAETSPLPAAQEQPAAEPTPKPVPPSKTRRLPASNARGGGLDAGDDGDPATLRSLERELVAA